MFEIGNELILIVVLVFFNAIFASSEIAMITLRSSRIKQLVQEGNKSAKAIDHLLKDPSRMLATIQIGVTLAGFMASAAAAVGISSVLAQYLESFPILDGYAQGIAVVIVTLIVSYVTLVLGELVPKRMAMQKAEGIALLVARPLDFLARIAGPFIAILTVSTNMVLKLLGGDPHGKAPKLSEEEIRLMLAEQGTLHEKEKEMIEGIFDFGDMVAREVMVPRTEMVSLECSLTINNALEKVVTHGFSRYPIYEKNIDNIIGVTNIKDLLNAIKENKGELKLQEIKREAYFIPESKQVLDLFREMQKRRIQIAVLLDEYGGTAGLVTIEDLIEEIVGEIDDEHNNGYNPIELISDTHAFFCGKVFVEEVNEILHLDLPVEEDYGTIAGLVFHCLGKKPRVGDQVTLTGVTIKVLEMDRNRIKKVEVIKELESETVFDDKNDSKQQ